MFGLRCLRCRGHGMRLHNRISIAQSLRALKLPNCRCLAALKIFWHRRRNLTYSTSKKTIWRDRDDNSNANKYQCLGELIPERKFQLFKRGATSPGVYSSLEVKNYESDFLLSEIEQIDPKPILLFWRKTFWKLLFKFLVLKWKTYARSPRGNERKYQW